MEGCDNGTSETEKLCIGEPCETERSSEKTSVTELNIKQETIMDRTTSDVNKNNLIKKIRAYSIPPTDNGVESAEVGVVEGESNLHTTSHTRVRDETLARRNVSARDELGCRVGPRPVSRNECRGILPIKEILETRSSKEASRGNVERRLIANSGNSNLSLSRHSNESEMPRGSLNDDAA
ncbi:unnamed protein product [Lasius platythorax]|uniref:Uncharacterized protein n=1 Tax=Lasius platythorax TaxID=488582 RepID=A0AAV2MY08_9HYME